MQAANPIRPVSPPAQTDVCAMLAAANRILVKYGVVDVFGHVSQRSPLHVDRFFIARSMAPALVTREDIVELDLEGNRVDPLAAPSYLERFIHAEIYRARPDVCAIVHSHSSAILPFTVVPDVPLQALCHITGFLGEQAPVFEIRTVAGDSSDLLVSSAQLGVALADCLGNQSIVLMRGHGSTTVGATLPQAVFRAVYAEINARVQFQSMQLGTPTYLSAGELKACEALSGESERRSWNLWLSEAEKELQSS